MTQQSRNNVSKLSRPERRIPVSATILALAFTVSGVQYVQKGEVSWLTNGFRGAENTVRALIGHGKADRLGAVLKEYQAKSATALSKLGDEAEQSAGELTSDSLSQAISNFQAIAFITELLVPGIASHRIVKIFPHHQRNPARFAALLKQYFARSRPCFADNSRNIRFEDLVFRATNV